MYLDVPDETTLHSTVLPLAGPSPTTTTAALAPAPVYDPSAGFEGAVGSLSGGSVPELAPAPAPAVAVAEQADLLDLYNIAPPMKDTR